MSQKASADLFSNAIIMISLLNMRSADILFVLQIMYIVSQFIFGYGVGGEYPMAAGSAAERAEAGGKAMAKKRGREVVLTFSMQVRIHSCPSLLQQAALIFRLGILQQCPYCIPQQCKVA